MRSATSGPPAAGPARPLRSAPAASAAVLAAALAGVLLGVLLAGPALAAPEPEPSAGPTSSSAAVVDATRPTARVVHGPNCSDGYVRVQVTNGTAERTVTLQYDGVDVDDPVTLRPGAGTTLEGPEVADGQRVEVQVSVSGPDGAEGPLPLGDYTRPAQEDCDAVGNPPPTSSAPTPTTTPTPDPTTSAPTTTTTPPTPPTTSAPSTSPSAPTTTTPRPTTSSSPTTSPSPTSPTTGTTTTTAAPPGGSASAGQVSPGSVVTIRGTGFDPGEQVAVTLAGIPTPLATVTADEQGRVEAVVQIPRDVVLGPAVVQLVGEQSAAATEVALEVAARETTQAAAGTPWPLALAGVGLIAVAAVLVAATRRPRADDWQPPAGSA